MTLRDATEYQFATAGRRVLFRVADSSPPDLGTAAVAYKDQLETLTGTTAAVVGPVWQTAGGADAVAVTATLPPAAPAARPTAVRAALLRFPGGPMVELAVHADSDDAGAEAEFHRLLDGARPTAAPNPAASVGEAIRAGSIGTSDHPSGPVRLPLTPDYRCPTAFSLAGSADGVRYAVEAAPAATVVREAAIGTALSPTASGWRSGRTGFRSDMRPARGPGTSVPAGLPH